jgi:hypothetical protein
MSELGSKIFDPQIGGLIVGLDVANEKVAFKNLGPAEAMITNIQVTALKHAENLADKTTQLKAFSLLNSNMTVAASQTDCIQPIPARDQLLVLRDQNADIGVWNSLDALLYRMPFEISFDVRSVDEKNQAASGTVVQKLRFVGENPTRFDFYSDEE